jgi:phosphoenolpyruvate-protein kinase (PTS system EI component)
MAAPSMHPYDANQERLPAEGSLAWRIMTGLCVIVLSISAWVLQKAQADISDMQSRLTKVEIQQAVSSSQYSQIEKKLDRIEVILTERSR